MEFEVIITLAKAALQLVETNPELAKGLFTEMGKMLGVTDTAALSQINSLTKELGAAKETISSLTKQLEDIPILGKELKTAENTISKLNNTISSLTEQLDEYKNSDIDKLKEENKNLKKEVETLKEEVKKYKPKREFTNMEKNQIIRKLHDKGINIDSYNYNESIEENLDELTEEEIGIIKKTAAERERTKEAIREDFFNNPKQVFIPGGSKGIKETFV